MRTEGVYIAGNTVTEISDGGDVSLHVFSENQNPASDTPLATWPISVEGGRFLVDIPQTTSANYPDKSKFAIVVTMSNGTVVRRLVEGANGGTLLERIEVAVYSNFDVAAAESSSVLRNAAGAIVTEMKTGQQHYFDALFQDTDGDYAGETLFISMSVNGATRTAVARIADTNFNRYDITPPASASNGDTVTFTWGRYEDESRTTSQVASVTLDVVQAAATGATALVVPSNISRGNWTAADWASYFGGDLVYSEPTGHEFIESTTFNGESAIRFNMVPSSIGSSRLSADGRIPETNHLKVEFDVVFLGNPDPNVFDFGGGANSSNGFKVSRQRGKFGLGFGRGEVGGGVNNDAGVRVRGMWDGQNLIDYIYKAGQTSFQNVDHSDGYVVVPNTKIRITREIKINSGYNIADGYMITTRDGNVVNNMQNQIWMTDGPLTVDRIVAANFYGGDDDTYSAQSEQDVLILNASWTDLS